MLKLTEMSWRAAQREVRCEGWSGSTAYPAGRLAADGGGECATEGAGSEKTTRCEMRSVHGSPRRGAERGRPLPSTQGGHLCAALPGCHRNEQRGGGWLGKEAGREVGGRTGAWGQGAGSCSSGAVASRARTRRRGPRGHGAPSPAPGPRPTCHHGAGGQAALPALAWPSQGNKSSPVPSSVPSRVQVGDGVLEKSAWRVGTERPCLPAGVPASKRAGPRGSGVALGLSPVCRLVSPLYLPPCLHHRCDFVALPHSPEAMGSGPPPGPCQTGRGQAWEGVRLFSPPPPSPTPPGIC